MTVPVVAIVGYSDSGKTRVATALTRILVDSGYRIAAVKHCHHGHQLDNAGKDTADLAAAGASPVVASSPGQITTIQSVEGDASLEEIVASIDAVYGLVIAEGFKRSTVPKVLVLGDEVIEPPPSNIIAVVGDGGPDIGVPRYGFDDLEALAGQLLNDLVAVPGDSPAIALVVDGVPVRLGDFPSTALSATIRGLVGSLKGVPKDPTKIMLTLDLPNQ
jgi:molybdopterin-guanine dinucleotide biosynthesis protein B